MTAPAPPARRFGQSALRTPANMVTIGRLVLAGPSLVLVHRDGSTWTTVGLWFVLSISDLADGYLARREGTTRSGAFLDPIADKVLVLGALWVLAGRGDLPWAPFVVISARELDDLGSQGGRRSARGLAARPSPGQVQDVPAEQRDRVRPPAVDGRVRGLPGVGPVGGRRVHGPLGRRHPDEHATSRRGARVDGSSRVVLVASAHRIGGQIANGRGDGGLESTGALRRPCRRYRAAPRADRRHQQRLDRGAARSLGDRLARAPCRGRQPGAHGRRAARPPLPLRLGDRLRWARPHAGRHHA